MTLDIHPTAVVYPGAQLGEGVRVGPFAVIESGVEVGPGCEIQAHAVLTGLVTVGAGCLIGYGAVVGAAPQDLSYDPTQPGLVRIGERNRIREYCTIHCGSRPGQATSVGDDCFIMCGTHLAHDVSVGNRVIIANNALLGGHVQIQDRVFIGGGSVFHQFVRIGTLAICQGLFGGGKDVPPYTMAAEINGVAGLNAVGLKRAGFSVAQRKEIKEAFALLYREGLNTTQALAKAKEREWGEQGRIFWNFVENSKRRGLCDWLGGRRGANLAFSNLE